ncbi:tRNA (adenosine(37)-N6)-dimethylallyltransferase [Campylobacter sp. RM16187]|uniref:tRNA (adenosine(37)-N6)-dimethylallyltransferase n=1 Tax=Campylobacter sp. RM16187 TaxID=1660063 RepID=UPI0021B64B75|nr:tRNA (adenosine(37)-N6)-dimethylallyltransferase MiaA [Campylobacter sp. RM16187]QKG28538.1 tRNA(i6A37) synthase [Campylobacter sp. RM16187]
MKELALIGATASGKTDLALKLASEFNGVILSLDSLCVYKQIDIASAKPSEAELASVRHFGINLIYPNEHFDVGMFFKIYKQAREFALESDKNLFITGGSGFYLKSLISGLSPKFERLESGLSNSEIHEFASKIDPEFASKFSQNDTYRLNKWLDIYAHIFKTENRTKEFDTQNLIKAVQDKSWQILEILTPPSIYLRENTYEPIISNLKIFEIVWDKEILRERIKIRTENMLKKGLLAEAKILFEKYPSEPKPLKSIGLKECGEFLRGKIDESELLELISTHTAQLAKRQRTFNRSQFEDKFSGSIKECEDRIREFLS